MVPASVFEDLVKCRRRDCNLWEDLLRRPLPRGNGIPGRCSVKWGVPEIIRTTEKQLGALCRAASWDSRHQVTVDAVKGYSCVGY